MGLADVSDEWIIANVHDITAGLIGFAIRASMAKRADLIEKLAWFSKACNRLFERVDDPDGPVRPRLDA